MSTPSVVAIFVFICAIYLMSLVFLRDRKKKNKNSLSDLVDDELHRETIKDETEKSYVKKFMEPIIEENPKLVSVLYKLFWINLEKNRTLVVRAGEEERLGDELSAMQLFWMLSATLGMIFLVAFGAFPFGVVCLLFGLLMRFLVFQRHENTYQRILREVKDDLPDFLEALRIPVENGMKPDNAFRRVASEWGGTLGRELKRVITESRNHGNLLYRPLEHFAFRMNYPALNNFVYSFIAGMQTGVDMSTYIGTLSNEIRTSANNDVLIKNRKKESKIVLIMSIFIFVPLIVMIIVPIVMQSMK